MSNETQPQGMVFGYSRVSTTEQDQALQEDALTKAGVDQIFTDTASGAKTSRPALDELLSFRPERLATYPPIDLGAIEFVVTGV